MRSAGDEDARRLALLSRIVTVLFVFLFFFRPFLVFFLDGRIQSSKSPRFSSSHNNMYIFKTVRPTATSSFIITAADARAREEEEARSSHLEGQPQFHLWVIRV